MDGMGQGTWIRRLRTGLRRWWGRPNPHPNIGMVGDGDDVAAIEEIEKDFGVSFDRDGLERIRTLGDLFDILIGMRPDLDRDESWQRYTEASRSSAGRTPRTCAPT